MLIVVENRDVADFLKSSFYFKTSGSGNILEVNSAERTRKKLNGINDFINILGTDAKRESIYAAESLEQCAFTFHNGHAGFGSDISETEYCGTVCDNRYEVVASGVLVRKIHILLNLEAGLRNTGSVSYRELFFIGNGGAADYFNLTGPFFVLLKCEFFFVHDNSLL